LHTYEKILQAIGQASVSCVGSDGIFDTNKAVAISKQLYLDITGIAPPDIKELAATDIQQLKAEICRCEPVYSKVAIHRLIKMGYPFCPRCGGKLSAV